MRFGKKLIIGIFIIGIVLIGAISVWVNRTEQKAAGTIEGTVQESDKLDRENSLETPEESSEESRPDFIMIQFEDQIRETMADLRTFEGFSMYIPQNWAKYHEYLTPPAELTLKGAGGEIWIECYEGETLAVAEARFQSEGYVFDTAQGKWQKAEGTLITRVQLEEKQGDVWALFRIHDEALVNPYGIDVVADTCIFTGISGDRPEKTKQDTILVSDAYYYEPARYFYEMDWENISSKIDTEEQETLQKFLPVLNGEAFTWIYRSTHGEEPDTYIHEKKDVNIREMLAQQLNVHGLEQVEPLLDSFYFADVFQSGGQNMVLCLRNMAYEWLILHEEDGAIYGIDMSIRWFSQVYENGLYISSGGAGDQSYHRMKFVDGDYIIEDVARVYMDKLIIDGIEKSDAEYEAWMQENLKSAAKSYNPLGEAE